MKKWLLIVIMIVMPAYSIAGDPTEWPKEIVDYYHLLTQKQSGPGVELPRYKMYMHTSGGGRALLNDEFVTVGDVYEDFTVESINKNEVVLKSKNGHLEVVPISIADSGVKETKEDDDQETVESSNSEDETE